MKKTARCTGLLVIGVLFYATALGQVIKGDVTDSTGMALPYASINLKNGLKSTVIAYTVSDAKGVYLLPVPAGTAAINLTVEARSLGYITEVKTITSFEMPVYFNLRRSVTELESITIKSSRPLLRTNGDTLSYKVSDFANPQDRTIGEVIRKLPGITVAADGTISYNNKPISALYIGGDNLLDHKYNIATNSIPQHVVNQVQVIQNDQPIKVLRNRVFSDAVALNLEIKKGAKLHVMGQESIGIGLPGNHDVDLNAMMFKDKYKAINYLAGNNVGYDLRQDLVSHDLTDYQRVDNALLATMLSLGAVNTPQIQQNRYFFNKAGIININNLINLKENIQVRVNAYYLHDTQKQNYTQLTTFYLPTDTIRYTETQSNHSIPDLFHSQFTLSINRDKYYLNDVLVTDQEKTTSYSELRSDNASINQVLQENTSNFSNELYLIKTLRSNHLIEVYSYISHYTKPEQLAIGSGYNAVVFNNNVPYTQLIQKVKIPGWYTNNYLSFKIPGSLVTHSYRTGFNVESQTLASGLYLMQKDNTSHLVSDSAKNQINWINKKLYAEAAYDLPGGVLKAHLSLPFTLQQINYTDKSLSRFYFNPQLNAQYQVSVENYIDLNYGYRNKIGTIEEVYPGYILTNYRTLYANYGSLGEQHIQQAGAGYSYRKALVLFFWNINMEYNHTTSNNITSSLITNNLQRGIVLPYPNKIDSWIMNGSISKYVFALNTTFSGSFQWRNISSVQFQIIRCFRLIPPQRPPI